MKPPISIPFTDIPWSPHPNIQGIQTRFFQNPDSHSPADVLIARVEVGGVIPWHVHEGQVEIAYVLAGSGVLHFAESQDQDPEQQQVLLSGNAVIVPAGMWHSVVNTGDEALDILAAHTR